MVEVCAATNHLDCISKLQGSWSLKAMGEDGKMKCGPLGKVSRRMFLLGTTVFFFITERKPEVLEKMGLLRPNIFFITGRKMNDNL